MISALLLVAALETTTATVQASAVRYSADAFSEDVLWMRDPFRRPRAVAPLAAAKSKLEQIPVDQFKYTGIITGPNRLRAKVNSPAGRTFFIPERTKIGAREG